MALFARPRTDISEPTVGGMCVAKRRGSQLTLYSPCGCATGGNYILEDEDDEVYASTDFMPVIAAGANGEVMIVWKRTTVSGNKVAGLQYKFGYINYATRTWYSTSSVADVLHK